MIMASIPLARGPRRVEVQYRMYQCAAAPCIAMRGAANETQWKSSSSSSEGYLPHRGHHGDGSSRFSHRGLLSIYELRLESA